MAFRNTAALLCTLLAANVNARALNINPHIAAAEPAVTPLAGKPNLQLKALASLTYVQDAQSQQFIEVPVETVTLIQTLPPVVVTQTLPPVVQYVTQPPVTITAPPQTVTATFVLSPFNGPVSTSPANQAPGQSNQGQGQGQGVPNQGAPGPLPSTSGPMVASLVSATNVPLFPIGGGPSPTSPPQSGNVPQGGLPQGSGNVPQGSGNLPQGSGNTPQGSGNSPQGQQPGNSPAPQPTPTSAAPQPAGNSPAPQPAGNSPAPQQPGNSPAPQSAASSPLPSSPAATPAPSGPSGPSDPSQPAVPLPFPSVFVSDSILPSTTLAATFTENIFATTVAGGANGLPTVIDYSTSLLGPLPSAPAGSTDPNAPGNAPPAGGASSPAGSPAPSPAPVQNNVVSAKFRQNWSKPQGGPMNGQWPHSQPPSGAEMNAWNHGKPGKPPGPPPTPSTPAPESSPAPETPSTSDTGSTETGSTTEAASKRSVRVHARDFSSRHGPSHGGLKRVHDSNTPNPTEAELNRRHPRDFFTQADEDKYSTRSIVEPETVAEPIVRRHPRDFSTVARK